MSVDCHGDGKGNGPGGRSKRFVAADDGIGAVGGSAGTGGGGAGAGTSVGTVTEAWVGLDSVADGDGERPFDDGQ
jgi:hypothetical protein